MTPRLCLLRAMDFIARNLPDSLTGTPCSGDGIALSPLLHWILKLRLETDFNRLGVAAMREGFRKDMIGLRAGYAIAGTRDLLIDTPSTRLPARRYLPLKENSLPVLLVFFHGGGFVMGDIETHDDLCRLICRTAGVQVLSVDYRRAPEHPFPGPPEDCLDAFRWAQEHAEDFGVHESAVAVGGDSAGANLATVTALMARQDRPALSQLLFYPGTDRMPNSVPPGSRRKAFLTPEIRNWFYLQYLGRGEHEARNPLVSPLNAESLADMPPAVLVTAGFDILRNEGQAYSAALARHGNKVIPLHFARLDHGFGNLVGPHRESEHAVIEAACAWRSLSEVTLKVSKTEQSHS
ncbi:MULTISPECIES: alpha/beta hydrolase [Paraburkholderia]|uniref:Alpha/beta hydrolase n=1 Tax=Paraburkholderia ferrariae TaxID=386056 RepID=A0ABU9RM80_9BURK